MEIWFVCVGDFDVMWGMFKMVIVVQDVLFFVGFFEVEMFCVYWFLLQIFYVVVLQGWVVGMYKMGLNFFDFGVYVVSVMYVVDVLV